MGVKILGRGCVGAERAAFALGFIQLRRLEARGPKLNRPGRQRAPSQPIHLMLVASERSACALDIKRDRQRSSVPETTCYKLKMVR
ncbi:hypothetical protein AM506_07110 [Rossellomorea vietnamensis]|uniref:Uncharacterized protein n=1 Tax=Rossellomorea vietnamensis TaxID=218284 RepID=A0A0P6WGI2_9BACI|nr:hypothetical protein AM506_07110 [Rossellomorea vietnamensis]